VATASVGTEDPGVPHHVKAPRRDQRAQAQQEFPRRESEDMPPVGEPPLHLVEQCSIGGLGKAVERESRAEAIARKPFQANSIVLMDSAAGV
jgi:hypothetical protein